MMYTPEAAEPGPFHVSVRLPGTQFLVATPNPNGRQFDNHPYWRRAARDLYDAYKGTCVYTCHRIALDTGARSVEHFVPKLSVPALAYEWSNLRLVCSRMNSRKGTHRDVLDPFAIWDGVFVLLFPGLQVAPGCELSQTMERRALNTIRRLNLNDEICISSRMVYVKDYVRGHVDGDFVRRNAPFLFHEIERQGGLERLTAIMGV